MDFFATSFFIINLQRIFTIGKLLKESTREKKSGKNNRQIEKFTQKIEFCNEFNPMIFSSFFLSYQSNVHKAHIHRISPTTVKYVPYIKNRILLPRCCFAHFVMAYAAVSID